MVKRIYFVLERNVLISKYTRELNESVEFIAL